MSKVVFAEDYFDCGASNGVWSEFIDPDVMEAIVAKQGQTHAQAAIEQAIKGKSLIQRIARSVKSICEK